MLEVAGPLAGAPSLPGNPTSWVLGSSCSGWPAWGFRGGGDRHPPHLASPAGELVYRLARPGCQIWNPADGLRFEPWPPAPAA